MQFHGNCLLEDFVKDNNKWTISNSLDNTIAISNQKDWTKKKKEPEQAEQKGQQKGKGQRTLSTTKKKKERKIDDVGDEDDDDDAKDTRLG